MDIQKLKFPLILLVTLLIPILGGNFFSIEFKAICYAVSLTMKSVLEFFLPFIIFSFIFSCLMNFQKGAAFFVFLLIVIIFCSNFTAILLGCTSGYWGTHFFAISSAVISQKAKLIPYWFFYLPKLISNDKALLSGFVAGIIFSIWPNPIVKKIGLTLNQLANFFLKKVFIPLLPIFVLGFVFKLEYEKVLQQSLNIYGPILILVLFTQWSYLGIWVFIVSRFSLERTFCIFKNIFPATLTGFSTISSAAAMPVLIGSTEKNLAELYNDPNADKQAKILIPAIINIHTLGSAIALPILASATLISFGYPVPTTLGFITFAFYMALAKYAVAGVPGGVVLIATPLLEKYLGFNNEMVGLITAIYLIFDPFGTAANVTGNGVFSLVFSKLHSKLSNLIR